MTDFATFGDPSRFEIAVRWAADGEPRARRPADHGWSMGDLRITVGNQVITTNQNAAAPQDHIAWYISPMFRWLARNWAALLHEEAFPWTERTPAPALVACHRAMDRSVAFEDGPGRKQYRDAQEWYRRHALRAGAEGGLFPDLFIRRFNDDIELSWSGAPPLFAPDGFVFVTEPGFARLPVAEVATPLWEALNWAASTCPPGLSGMDRARHAEMAREIEGINDLTAVDFDGAYVSPEVIGIMREAFASAERSDLVEERVSADKPFIEEFSPAVAMFGGVSPRLERADVEALRNLLIETSGGRDGERLAALVSDAKGALGPRPHEDGYEMAEDLLEALALPGDEDFVDVEATCAALGVRLIDRKLRTDSIRGVALAGEGFSSTILVNETSVFNSNALGRRFTIAHELCHILFDRSRARRVAHVSGRWAAPGVERRANAFAAFLLMPRSLLLRHLGASPLPTIENVVEVAEALKVNESALVEHLYNMDFIDEPQRERLRAEFRRH